MQTYITWPLPLPPLLPAELLLDWPLSEVDVLSSTGGSSIVEGSLWVAGSFVLGEEGEEGGSVGVIGTYTIGFGYTVTVTAIVP